MAETTKIQWTDHTFNPWIGCTKVSPGCSNCYAEKSTPAKFMGIEWGRDKPRHRTSDDNWKKPITWNNKAVKSGVRTKVFCASLCDVFDLEVPQEWRDDLWASEPWENRCKAWCQGNFVLFRQGKVNHAARS